MLIVCLMAALTLRGAAIESEQRQYNFNTGLAPSPPLLFSPLGQFLFQRQRPAFGVPGLTQGISSPFPAIGDFLLMSAIGIPLVGLMALGGLVLLPIFGVNLGAIGLGSLTTSTSSASGAASSSAAGSSGIKEDKKQPRMDDDVVARVMDSLQRAFVKYHVTGRECEYRAVCEAQQMAQNAQFKSRMVKDIASIFSESRPSQWAWPKERRHRMSGYLEAAKFGRNSADCARLFASCDKQTNAT